jgi:adenylate cyclase
MAVEIERKFLVRSDAWRNAVTRSDAMTQFYLASVPQLSIRLRIVGERATLNIKGRTVGRRRMEFEYPVPLADARALGELADGPRIEKLRHYLPAGRRTWEIDEFLGDNAGLVVAEIELQFEDEPIDQPDWLGREVTGDARYYNVCLAERPWREWAHEGG